MSDPLLTRISETASRAHDTNLELLELADELREFASRACGETARLQKTIKGGLEGATLIARVKAEEILRKNREEAERQARIEARLQDVEHMRPSDTERA